jgi:hypothetical protein
MNERNKTIAKPRTLTVMGERTRLVKAVSSKDSLRTTIPMFCVRQWKLDARDELDWSIETVKGESVMVVRKVSKEKK